jgi:hypothetical protein
MLNIVSSRDRLVPEAAAPDAGVRITVDAGHVGMMVGSRARTLLYEPLAHWLAGLPPAPARGPGSRRRLDRARRAASSACQRPAPAGAR